MRKIRFFCDTNNNFVYLSRIIKSFGFDAKVVSKFSIEGVFYRVFDTIRKKSDWDSLFIDKFFESQAFYRNWFMDENKSKNYLNEILDGDCISIGSSYAPAIFELMGKKLDVFFPTGSDSFYMPFYKDKEKIERDFNVRLRAMIKDGYQRGGVKGLLFSLKKFYSLPRLQKSGIENSNIALQDPCYLEGWKNQTSLKITKLAIPMYDPDDVMVKDSASVISKIAKEIRLSCDFLAVCFQKNNLDKGTDSFVEGFIKFYNHFNGKAKLIISERGGQWWVSRNFPQEFKKLVDKKDIIIAPSLPSSELCEVYQFADCAFGMINNYDSYLNSTISEILALGIPLISKIKKNYLNQLSDVYPYLHVESSGDVCNALKLLSSNNALKDRLSVESKEWFTQFRKSEGEKWVKFLSSLPN